MRLLGVSLGCVVLAIAQSVCAQLPEIQSIVPFSGRPGETVQVTLRGKHLLKPNLLWTSFGGQTSWKSTDPGTANGARGAKGGLPDGKVLAGSLTLPKEAPLGVGFVQLPTATGLSGPLLFLVDELPLVVKRAGNASRDKAQVLQLPVGVEGATEAGQSDVYAWELKQGEAVSVEVYGIRIGSKLDPVLRLLDAQGGELAVADDTAGLAGDCRLRYVAPKEGRVFLEIRDSSYFGGDAHFYHLRVGDFPMVSTVFPPVAAPGSTVQVRVASDGTGETTSGMAPISLRVPEGVSGSVSLPVRFSAEKPAGFASVRVEKDGVILGAASEEARGGGSRVVTLPGTVAGCLQKPKERHVFQLELKKDERVRLTPVTREIGSPAMLYLGVEDERGVFVAENAAPAAANAPLGNLGLSFTAARDGVYRVLVEEIARRGGAEFVYEVRMEKSRGSLELKVKGDRFLAPLGGEFTMAVSAQRQGFSEPITLELLDAAGRVLPDGFRCENHVLGKGQSETVVKVSVPGDVPPGTLYHLRMVGRAEVSGEKLVAEAVCVAAGDEKKEAPDTVSMALRAMPCPPMQLRRSFPVCVGPEAPDFFRMEVVGGEVALPSVLAKHSFVLRQTALDPGFSGNIQLRFEGLPSGVQVAAGSPRGGRIRGQVDYICEVSAPASVALGRHAFEVIGVADYKGVHKEVRLAKVPLKVVLPLGVSAEWAGPLVSGGRQKLKIALQRFQVKDPQAVTVRFMGLPPGLSGPGEVRIEAAQSEAMVELAVAAGSAGITHQPLQLAATTRIEGMEVQVESAPIAVEVQK